jgi:acyl phosphate:glycerol-3-phosphate acyltransferase
MDPIVRLFIVTLLGYLVGSIPTGVIVSRLFFGFDIREKGSGNMGSTNVFRVLGVRWGVLVQVIDVLKGLVAVSLIAFLFHGEQIPFENRTPFEDMTIIKIICGLSAVIGHIYSVFVKFKGGKGVNTAAGMLIGIAPVEVAVIVGVFILTLTISGYVSLGSILAAMALPITMVVRYNIFNVNIEGYHTVVYFLIGLSVLVIFAHRANVQRLMTGSENRFQNLQIFKRFLNKKEQ